MPADVGLYLPAYSVEAGCVHVQYMYAYGCMTVLACVDAMQGLIIMTL